MSDSDDFYKVMELPSGASLRRVKEQYRELAKAYHPDLYPYDEEYRKRCEKKMRAINEAYQFLRGFAPAEDEAAAKTVFGGAWGYTPDDPGRGREQPKRSKPGAPKRPKPQPAPEARWSPEDVDITPGEPGVTLWDGRTAPKEPSWGPIRSVPQDEPDFPGLWQTTILFFLSIAALAAIFFLPSPAPAVYFEAMRLITSVSCAYGAYFSLVRGSWEITLALVILGAALNPVLPVPMSHEEWKIFNFIAPGALVYFWVILFERESKLAHRQAIRVKKATEK